MLIHADVKGLELVTAAYLSQDQILIRELTDGVDIHGDNQDRFGFEKTHEGRRLAKVFVFKLIYGGTAYGFSQQWEFQHISKRQEYWQELIDEFYGKYKGVKAWHDELVRTVVNTGRLEMPTGRIFQYPQQDVVRRLWYWKPKILNYPVQGTGADLVCIGRVVAWKRLRKANMLVVWQSTVHDSLDIDVESCYTNSVCKIVDEAIRDIPINFYRLFGREFNVPVGAEVYYGHSLGDLTQYASNGTT